MATSNSGMELHKTMVETVFENARELERKRQEIEDVD